MLLLLSLLHLKNDALEIESNAARQSMKIETRLSPPFIASSNLQLRSWADDVPDRVSE